jgi:uncharacterized protein YodC (DUF2158 family)
MPNSYSVGDVVQLKSGGPQMTIESSDIHGYPGKVLCKWWSEKEEKYEEDMFSAEALLKAE